MMSSSALSQGDVKRWRLIVFVIVAGLLAMLALYGGVFDLLLLPGQSGFPSQVHLWHQAQSGTLIALLFGGNLLALLWRPQSKPLLAQFLLLSLATFGLGLATLSGFGFLPIALGGGIVLIGLLAAAYPSFRGLMSFSREGPFSLPLLAISLVAALFFAPIVWRELQYQWAGAVAHDEHALNYHWLTSVLLAVLLVVAGVLSSTRRPGWQVLGLITAVAYLYLGSMAVLLANYAGSWGIVGGAMGVLAGLGYITATLLEGRKSRQATSSTRAKEGGPSSRQDL
jgi:hypothetical protein